MRCKLLIITILIVICFPSCTKNKRRDEAIKIVCERTGTEGKFPKNVPCYLLGKNSFNQFPRAMQYQYFLFDVDNKVLLVGSPILILKIWNLYKSQIADRVKKLMQQRSSNNHKKRR